MDNQLKQEFTLRITQANKTELCIILYEMFMIYIDDALNNQTSGDIKEFRVNIKRARGCLKELMGSLNFEYELAQNLLSLYMYVTKLLATADIHNQSEPLTEANHIMKRLHDAYDAVKGEDKSGPVMGNTQTVYAGLTYGKNDLNISMQGGSNRGFLV